MPAKKKPAIDPGLVKARMRVIGSARKYLEDTGYLEVQTPVLHPRLSGFEKGTGFSTYSASLGERLWFRAAPELYLKRLLVGWGSDGPEKIFEIATCLRDELDEEWPRESFDRPEFTLLEAYASAEDHWSLEPLLRGMLEAAIARLEGESLLPSSAAKTACARLRLPWQRRSYAELLSTLDGGLDLERLLRSSWSQTVKGKGDDAALQAKAMETRAADPRLREAAATLTYRVGKLAPYLRTGPQDYWYDFLDHAFQTKVAPTLKGPIIVHGLPVESSPLAASNDGIHCEKWELYLDGVRVALGQRELMDPQAQKVRFQHLDRLRRLGYDLMPEPDERFIDDLASWPAGRPLIGLGLYLDRVAGSMLGLVQEDGRGQERMVPHLFKSSEA